MKNVIRFSIIATCTIVASKFGQAAQSYAMFLSFSVLYIVPGLAWGLCINSWGPRYVRKWLSENRYKEVVIEPVFAKTSPFPAADSLQLVFRVKAQDTEKVNKELWFLFGGGFWGCLKRQVEVKNT